MRVSPIGFAVVAAVGLSLVLAPGNATFAEAQKRGRAPRKALRSARPQPQPVPSPSPTETPTIEASFGSAAETDRVKLARIRARRQAVEAEIRKLRSQTESTLLDLDTLDLDLRLAAHQHDEAEIEFKETTRALDTTLREIQATRARIEATKPRVMKSLAALGKLGELSYVRLLFSLDDPADILRGYRYVSRIASSDGEQIRGFRESLAKLSALEIQLKERTAQNVETRRRLYAARTSLSAQRAHKQERLAEIARETRLQESLAGEYQKREAELLKLLGEAVSENETTPSQPGSPFHADIPLRARRGDLPWPAQGAIVKKFGVERDPRFGTRTIQQGIEIDAFPEVAVHAVHQGRVVFADQFVGYGMLVIIDHGNREHTLYGRLGELRVSPGQDVAEGTLVGLLPNTRVTGSGLHFEVRVQGKPEDPQDWLKRP